jgi:hypothetical protein
VRARPTLAPTRSTGVTTKPAAALQARWALPCVSVCKTCMYGRLDPDSTVSVPATGNTTNA